jgi:hypothetical protein
MAELGDADPFRKVAKLLRASLKNLKSEKPRLFFALLGGV